MKAAVGKGFIINRESLGIKTTPIDPVELAAARKRIRAIMKPLIREHKRKMFLSELAAQKKFIG